MQSLRQSCARYQFSPRYAADGILFRFAHINENKLVASIHLGLQISRSDFEIRADADLRLKCDSAEFLVINQLSYGWILAADWALWILSQLQLAKLHFQSIKQQQSPDERLSLAEYQL